MANPLVGACDERDRLIMHVDLLLLSAPQRFVPVDQTRPALSLANEPRVRAGDLAVKRHAPNPTPPTGHVSAMVSIPAIRGRTFVVAALTEGSEKEAVYASLESHTSVIQISSASVGSFAIT